ncbi:MAG: DNA-processing protein DprA [Bacteroidales bacterium]|nr:DNA-processing protein DprA [Bacteroidales bacterium]
MSQLHRIALSMLRCLSPQSARLLLEEVKTPEAVFDLEVLREIKGLNPRLLEEVSSAAALRQAEREMDFMEKSDVCLHWFEDEDYPARLRACPDAPLLLYSMGEAELNPPKMLSIVGTRKMTAYGRMFCEQFIQDLAGAFPDLTIVSGLAYGVDICAHRTALNFNLKTLAVLAHGLDRIYPPAHRQTAKKIVHQGALLTEMPSFTQPLGWRFVQRNRIVAGLSDACVVVESAEKGGSLITAYMAREYNREVFALPGRTIDPFSRGCNKLIKNQVAALLEKAEDLIREMNWDKNIRQPSRQQTLFPLLDVAMQEVFDLFAEGRDYDTSELYELLRQRRDCDMGYLLSLLLQLELYCLIRALPGNKYRLY